MYVPGVEYEKVGGVVAFEVLGVAPVAVQEYDGGDEGSARLEHELTETVGVIVAPMQMSGILLITTIGGCLTITVWTGEVTLPHELVVVKDIE